MRAALVIAAAFAGCSSPSTDPCVVGDPGAPLAIRAVTLDAELTPVLAADGARVALMRPPQGGRVLYAGLEAQNLDRCKTANVVGALRDPTTHAVYGLEGRPVVLASGRDGWAEAGEQQPSSYANVAVCPNQRSSRDIDEESYELYLKLTDGAGRFAETTVDVVPFCAEPANLAECQCICKTGYVLGESCGSP